MPPCTQYDLVDALTETATALGWEPLAAETTNTHATMTFMNPAALEALAELERDSE